MTDPHSLDPDTAQAIILPPAPDEMLEAAAVVPLRYRFDGWTAAKQRRFLAALGDTGCVRDGCRMVGMSKTSAYRLRARSAEFAAEWDRALMMAGTVLEQVAFQRAVIGIEEPVWHYGKFMGMRRRYSDGLLRLLILRGDVRAGMNKTPQELLAAAHEAAKLAGGSFYTKVSDEEVDRGLWKNLEMLRKRMLMEEREKAIVLLEQGLCP
jgi:hypothetical protein